MKKNFNYFILFVFSAFLMSGSCMEVKAPEFVKMKDWHIQRVTKGYFEINSKAQFFNPNKVGVKLTNVYVDVYLDDEKVGTINQINEIKVPKNSAFEVPLLLVINTDGKTGLLASNALKLLSDKKAVVNYRGFIQVKKAGIALKVDLLDKYEFSIKDLLKP